MVCTMRKIGAAPGLELILVYRCASVVPGRRDAAGSVVTLGSSPRSSLSAGCGRLTGAPISLAVADLLDVLADGLGVSEWGFLLWIPPAMFLLRPVRPRPWRGRPGAPMGPLGAYVPCGVRAPGPLAGVALQVVDLACVVAAFRALDQIRVAVRTSAPGTRGALPPAPGYAFRLEGRAPPSPGA